MGKHQAEKGYTGRYCALLDVLAATDADEVRLSFAEIERAIGRPLSISACVDQPPWRTYSHPHVRAWRAMGWEAWLDRKGGGVVWQRMAAQR